MRAFRISTIVLLMGVGPAGAAARPVEKATAAWRAELPSLRMEEADLAIPSASPPYFPLSSVETSFSTPTRFPVAASAWLDRADAAADLTALERLGVDLAGSVVEPSKRPAAATLGNRRLPPPFKQVIGELLGAMEAAQPHLDAAEASMTDDQRAAFSELFGWGPGALSADDEWSSRRMRRRLGGLTAYQEAEMRMAAALVLPAVDDALVRLKGQKLRLARRMRWKTPVGDVMIGRSAGDVYRPGDLDGVALLIEPGGDNVYNTAIAAAGPGQQRVAIDLGGNVTVAGSSATPTAASSYFGLAVLALPNPSGFKRMKTGDYSQSATIGGVSALLIRGTCDLYAGHYSQAAAVAGIAVFDSEGDGSRFESAGNGQGFGYVRAAGIFRLRGNNATLRGGLGDPDPREPKGSSSLCQGVGFGIRAFSGGGVGLCSLAGDGMDVLSSYFAQGAGYWHAAGAFRIHGNDNRVQGRRYDQGSGVHNAFGHFEALGDRNRILNWGVGPAYGWDHGVGSAIIVGNSDEVQVDWGAGTASIGSRSFGFIDGSKGRYRLAGWGTGQWFRNEPAYAFAVIAGSSQTAQSIGPLDHAVSGRAIFDLWGVTQLDEVRLVRDLHLTPPEWPDLERTSQLKSQTIDLRQSFSEAQQLLSADRVAAIADVAGAFTLDKETPRRALETLVTLSTGDAPLLVEAVEPAAVDPLIQLSIAIAAHGEETADALSEVPAGDPREPYAIHFLGTLRPTVAIPRLEDKMTGGGRRTAMAVRALGSVMNRDVGQEPGVRAVMDAVAAALEHPSKKNRQAALTLLGRVRLADAFGLLSALAPIGPRERLAFLHEGPEDVTERIGERGAEAFLKIVQDNPGSRLSAERAALKQAERRLRAEFRTLAASTDAAVAQAAITATGQIGNAGDAAWIEPMLDHPRAAVREAAAVALGRMGDGGVPALLRAARSASARTRAMAAVGAGFDTSAAGARVLEVCLSDDDPTVAGAAMAAIRFYPVDALKSAIPALKKKAARRLKSTTDRDLDLNLRLLLAD